MLLMTLWYAVAIIACADMYSTVRSIVHTHLTRGAARSSHQFQNCSSFEALVSHAHRIHQETPQESTVSYIGVDVHLNPTNT
jgi:hypothetical protein